MSKTLIDKMVNRFLCWKLPADFAPDCGISFKRESDYEHPEFGRNKYEPTGTNLLTAEQAQKMFEYVLGADGVDAERWQKISTLMFIGNVELNQDEDGGYSISVDPVENIVAQSWSGDSPEEAIDAVPPLQS